MSNSWNYTLIFEDQRISQAMLTACIETVNSFGYSVWNHRSEISGISLNGEENLKFTSLETASDFLCSRGGMIDLWKRYESNWDDGIDITFKPAQGELSVGVIHDLRDEREEDVQKAIDLEGLFLTLCKRFEPVYGYSTDEYRLEAALDGKDFLKEWEEFNQAIRSFQLPPILFWLNYFCSFYLQQIEGSSLSSVPCTRKTASSGTFIQLADHPWKAPIAILTADRQYCFV